MLKEPRIHKIFLLISAAIVLQGTMVLIMQQGAIALRFYTVQSNLLLVFGFIVMAFLGERGKVFRSYLSFAVLVCISITGIVYNFILVPFGGQTMVLIGWGNFVTHLLAMLLAVANYFMFEEKGTFTFRHIWAAILPTLLYWAVFMAIGPLLGDWYPYFFMTPWQVGWPMVFFWFFVILIFIVGLTSAIVLLDINKKKHSLLSFCAACLACIGLVLAFGDNAPPTLVSLSYTVEDVFALEDGDNVAFLTARQTEEGLSLGFQFFTTEERMHSVSFGMRSQNVVTAFLLTDSEGEILMGTVDSDFVLEGHGGLRLSESVFSAEWFFLRSYEDILHFFARMDLGEIPSERSAHFQEILSHETTDGSVYLSFLLR
ncbi:MAG: Pr6Pr family membrane protein [Defluviitaleaceae bacterium]|nr:Pr6Pr family membrane protein [Defluviitaleaceae bacterium]